VVVRFSDAELAAVCASARRAGLAVRAWLGDVATAAAYAEAGDQGTIRRRLLRDLLTARMSLADDPDLVVQLDVLVDLLVACP
jgi:hypothetical protein